jgi:hypothetical protein
MVLARLYPATTLTFLFLDVGRLRKLQKTQSEGDGNNHQERLYRLVLDNVESLSNETEIAQAMREYDNEMKANKNDPKAAAARARLQRRLQLRQHQLKAESMNNELKEKIEQCEDVRTV